jgi:hypothetical protein
MKGGKKMIMLNLMKRLVIIICVLVFVGCTMYESPIIYKTRQDMDNIVNLKGMPLSISETFIGGRAPRHNITLMYADMMYIFQTNPEKSYSIMTLSSSISYPANQEPLPAWFKAKYPSLNWKDVPVK